MDFLAITTGKTLPKDSHTISQMAFFELQCRLNPHPQKRGCSGGDWEVLTIQRKKDLDLKGVMQITSH